MQLIVSISADEIDFIDRYAAEHGVDSRSGVIQRAVSLLRISELGAAYEAAWDEWDTHDSGAWDTTAAHGLRR